MVERIVVLFAMESRTEKKNPASSAVHLFLQAQTKKRVAELVQIPTEQASTIREED